MQLKNTVSIFLSKIMFITMMLVLPMYGISQGPAAPTVDGGVPAGETGAVPFDGNMNLLFLAAGLAFTVMVSLKQRKQKAVANQ